MAHRIRPAAGPLGSRWEEKALNSMFKDVRRASRNVLFLLCVLCVAARVRALTPDDIALVVNSKVPEGRALAELYASQRHIPAGRIIELSIDPVSPISPAEEMPFEEFEPQVAEPVRDFLRRNKLTDRVKCLVTFWGIPLRIGTHHLTPSEIEESSRITLAATDVRRKVQDEVDALEQSASQLDPSFKVPDGTDLHHLARRLDAVVPVIVKALPSIKDPAARTALYKQMLAALQRLLGNDRAISIISQPSIALFSPNPPQPRDVEAARQRVANLLLRINLLELPSAAPADRLKAETLAHDDFGLIGYGFLLEDRKGMLDTDQSQSALDSELSLLWWNHYPRAKWVPNPLEWRTQAGWRARNVQPPPTLMVTRLDGPAETIVRNIILTSVKVESEGLHGQIAIDARGRTGNDPYTEYDQKLRRLAEFVQQKTKLQLTFDNKESLIPGHSLQNIALYCGWYSLRNYSPPGSFSPGAIGYHVASLELVSLRQPNEHGWVRGLLSDGVVGTLGPVAEPYLQSFPPPEEFFPLLMTGRLTLAEVYWRTLPWSSWMQTCIGDPLYNPYKTNPPLTVSDLPPDLRAAIATEQSAGASTQPARP